MKNYTRPMLYRIKTIHEMIKNGSFPNSSDFCAKTGQSRPTIMRDIEVLKCDFNAPIKYDKKNNGYYYSSKDYNLPFNYLDEMSAETLLCIKTLMQNFNNTPFYENLSKMINSMIDLDSLNNDKNFLDRIEVAPTLIYQKVDENKWQSVLKAIKNNNVIEFNYTSKGITKHIIAHPYQIVLDNGKTFIFTNTLPDNSKKLFAIFKLENLKVLDKTFTLPESFKFSQFTNNARLGAYAVVDNEIKQYKIMVSGNTQDLLKTIKFADDQKSFIDKKNNSTTYTFTSTQEDVIFNYLIYFGDDVCPLEPKELVDKWKENKKNSN